MKTIIFDLDDTLIDTYKIKNYIFNFISSLGVDYDVVLHSYEDSKSILGNYTIEQHIKFLEKKLNYSLVVEDDSFAEKIDFRDCLFPMTVSVLEGLKEDYKIILLTKGEKDFQGVKIKNSGLSKYFSDIYIVEDHKHVFLKNIKLEASVIFVNDKDSENKKIKECFPYFVVVDSLEKLKGLLN